jgi:hypothetical protein
VSAGRERPRSRNDAALARLEPYLVAPPWHRAFFDPAPFGLAVPDGNVIDPTRTGSSVFLDRLMTLDRLTFGPEGMPMPRWIFYEGSEMTGGIFGFACRAESLSRDLAARLDLAPGDAGLFPLSMYIAIPARPPGTWFGHNLASLNRVLPELALRGLASMTKAVALVAYRCRRQVGATQWDSAALHIHTRFGPLELLSAWTPAHADPATLTYAVDLTETRLRHALGDPEAALDVPPPDFHVTAGDEPAMRRLQARVEAGERFVVAGPPRRDPDGGPVSVPVARTSIRPGG